MIPETNIRNAISNLWVEKFPHGNTTSYPKGLIKRIAMPALKYKGVMVDGRYDSRISILWYDKNTDSFDTKMAEIQTAMEGIKSDAKIYSVIYENREHGYDPNTDLHVMELEYIVKHNL